MKKRLFVLAILTIAMFPHVIIAKDKPLKLMDGVFYEGSVNNKMPEGQGELYLLIKYKMSAGYERVDKAISIALAEAWASQDERDDKAISIKGIYKENEIENVCVMDGYYAKFYAREAIYQINKKEKEISFEFKDLSFENRFIGNSSNSSFRVVYKYSKPYWEIKDYSKEVLMASPVSIGEYGFVEKIGCNIAVDHNDFSFKKLSHELQYNDAFSVIFEADGYSVSPEENRGLDFNNFQLSSPFGSFTKKYSNGNFEKFSITAKDGSTWTGLIEHTGYGDYDKKGRSLKEFTSKIKYSDGREYEGTIDELNGYATMGLLASNFFKSQPTTFDNVKFYTGQLKGANGQVSEFIYGEEKKAAPTYSKSYPLDEYVKFLKQKGSLTYTFSGASEKMEGKNTGFIKQMQMEKGDFYYKCKLVLKSDNTGTFTFDISASEQAQQNQSVHLRRSGGNTRHFQYVNDFAKALLDGRKSVEGRWKVVNGMIQFEDRTQHHDFIVESNDVIVWDFLEPCRLKLNR